MGRYPSITYCPSIEMWFSRVCNWIRISNLLRVYSRYCVHRGVTAFRFTRTGVTCDI